MELLKLDIINGQIIKTFSDSTRSRVNISDLEGPDLIKFQECAAMAHTLESEFLFISININKPITRVVFFLSETDFKEYLFEDLTLPQQSLFNSFLNL